MLSLMHVQLRDTFIWHLTWALKPHSLHVIPGLDNPQIGCKHASQEAGIAKDEGLKTCGLIRIKSS